MNYRLLYFASLCDAAGCSGETVASDARELKRAASIANLAQSLDMRVIAGGVDSAATLAALAEAGIDFVQGDHLGDARLLKRIDFAALAASP